MPLVTPFRGIHYDFAHHGDLSPLLSPPHGAVDEDDRAALEAASPYNAVRIEAPAAALPGDGGAETRFSRSARLFDELIARRVLVRDDRPAVYALEQRFVEGGERRSRRTFLARLQIGGADVLPHEKTIAARVDERLHLLRALGGDTGPLFVLHDGDAGAVQAALAEAVSGRPNASGTLAGVEHLLWRVEAPAVAEELARLLAGRRAYLVHGHHRYEAALQAGARTMLACFGALGDPSLAVRPIHRLVVGVEFALATLLLLLDEHFEIEALPEDVGRPAGRAWAMRRLAEAGRGGHALLMVSGADRRARLLRLKQGIDLAHVGALPRNPTLRAADVALLQGLVLQHTLAMAPEAHGWGEHLAYEPDPARAIERVLGGGAELAFLLNPTPLWQMRAVADAGERLPPRSTLFHPPIPAGLVFDRNEGYPTA